MAYRVKIENYPLQNKAEKIDEAAEKGNRKIRNVLSKEQYNKFKNSVPKLKKPYNKKQSHSQIVRHAMTKGSIDKKDPDMYVMGGPAGAGKGYLKKKLIKEKYVNVDPDEYKETIATHYKPPLPKYPLSHAAHYHNESKVISKKVVNRAIKEKRNIVYDKTMKTLKDTKKVISKAKRAGYDIHMISTQKQPVSVAEGSVHRFLEIESAKGRYVPADVAGANANKINRNTWKARKSKIIDQYRIYDSTNHKYVRKVEESKGFDLNKNFRDPK